VKKIAESISAGAFEYLVKTDWKLDDVVSKIREQLSQ